MPVPLKKAQREENLPHPRPGHPCGANGLFRPCADGGNCGDSGTQEHRHDPGATSEYPGAGGRGPDCYCDTEPDAEANPHDRTHGDAGNYFDTGSHGNSGFGETHNNNIDSNADPDHNPDADANSGAHRSTDFDTSADFNPGARRSADFDTRTD